MLRNEEIQRNYKHVLARVQAAAMCVGRDPESVMLLPVSKLHPTSDIQALYDIGVRSFAENRVEELQKKESELPDDIHWHFIGNLQSRKIRQLIGHIDLIHSVFTDSIAEEINHRATKPTNILLEANISGEQAKGGVLPSELPALLERINSAYPNVHVIGLMGMASFESDAQNTRPQFQRLKQLQQELQTATQPLATLSMGMTNDFEIAIEEGATIVRVGSAIFGERHYA